MNYCFNENFNLFPENNELDAQSGVCFQLNSSDWPIKHSHTDYWEFLLIINGCVNHVINEKQIVLKNNTLCLIRLNDTHYIKKNTKESIKLINVAVKDDVIRKQFNIVSPEFYDTIKNSTEIFFNVPDELTFRMEKMISNYFLFAPDSFEQRNYHKKAVLSMLVSAMLECFMINHSAYKYPKPIADIIRAFDAYNLLNLNVGEICELVKYSSNQLNNLFKKHLNMTTKEFLTRSKINHACNLLKLTSKNITDIAFDIGYKNLGNFNAAFKKQTGISPKAYRKGR